MSRVLISGYYGFHNAGDEAVLYGIVRALRQRAPRLEIAVLSADPEDTARTYGVAAFNRWNPFTVLGQLRRADLVISGGGSLLQDVTGPRSILYYLGVVLAGRLLGRPVAFYAQGIGPLTTWLGRTLVRLIVNRVNLVTVRDEASARLLRDLGVHRPPIRVTADPVLGLEAGPAERERGRQVLERAGLLGGEKDAPLVGVAMRDWRGLEGYKRAVAAACDDLVRSGHRVVFLPLHFPQDIAACREAARLMREPSSLLREHISAPELLGVVANLHLLIGIRLHALVMAAVAGVPFVGISYDPKVDSFLRLVEQRGAGRVETLEHEGLGRVIQELLAERERVRGDLANRVAGLRREARQTADLVLALLPEGEKPARRRVPG